LNLAANYVADVLHTLAVAAFETKITTTLSCAVSSTQLTIGDSITVSGSIAPAVSSVNITLTYTKPSSSTLNRTITSAANGSYSDCYVPDCVGSWNVKASWNGDDAHEGATSTSVYFNIIKISSNISCSVSPTSTTIGSNITVFGSITPTRLGVTAIISYRSNTSWNTLTTITSASDGSYSYSWKPTSAGVYLLKASWAGDSAYNEAISNVISVTVIKISTSISCSVSPFEVTVGSSITVSGSISPAISDDTVTLTYKKPDGSTFNRTVTISSDGNYSDICKLNETGSWSVTASWAGDSTYEGASSSSKSFTVKKKSACFIATATYGSELSPEVQFLREFRDQMVLPTFTGSQFMVVFNQFYYSFSPTVASILVGNSILRDVMKIILYPLIGILHSAYVIFSSFSFSPELAIVFSGLVASSLIGMVYLAPLLFILSRIKRIRDYGLKTMRILSIILASSLLLTLVAETISSSIIMMFASGMLVLTSLSLSALLTTSGITKLLKYKEKSEF
jgi:peptide/nickel transport system substrate-binding protein